MPRPEQFNQPLIFITMKPTTPNQKLPLFQLVIDDNDDLEGINAISLVEQPAIEIPFIMMGKDTQPVKFAIASQEKQILFGPVLVPGQPIYRRNFTIDGDANVFFSADDVEKIVQKFFRQKNEGNVNLEHALSVDGAVLYQSFISDKENGIDPKQFADLPDKTFFVAYKVYDEDLWQSCKEGIFTGFSLEGFFDSVHIKNMIQPTDEQILQRLIDMLEI
jgi:hypothetical protein